MFDLLHLLARLGLTAVLEAGAGLEAAAGHSAVHDVLRRDVRRRVNAGHEVRPEHVRRISRGSQTSKHLHLLDIESFEQFGIPEILPIY